MERFAFALYTALLRLAVWLVGVPLLPIALLVSRRVRHGLGDLFGRVSGDLKCFNNSEEPLVWLHGVSVGEVNAMRPLLTLLRRRGLRKFYITSTCPEGVARAREFSVEGDCYAAYHPLDLPEHYRNLLAELKPAAVLVMEVDLWPNLVRAARRRGVPVVLANARVSPKTYRFYRCFAPLSRGTFGRLAAAYAQSDEDRDRLVALGCDPARTETTGNLKFDIAENPAVAPEVLERFLQVVRRSETLFTLVGGSTHPGEERLLLESGLELMRRGAVRREDLLLVLAPRNIRRAGEVIGLGTGLGYNAAAWSNHGARGLASPTLLVIDRLGVLTQLYRLATVAYVGGSQAGARGAAVGGHNVIEPVAAGKVALFGPDMRNFQAIADQLLAEGIAFTVRTPAEIADRVAALIASPERGAESGRRLAEFFDRHQGVARRVITRLEAVNPLFRDLSPRGANA